MNWMQVETYLRADDRVVLPIGSTEQHAYLSLAPTRSWPSGSRSKRRSRSACPCSRRCRSGSRRASRRSRDGVAPPGDARRGRRGGARLALRPGLPPLHHRERPRRQRPGPGAARVVGRRHGGARLRFHSWWDSPAVRAAAAEVYPARPRTRPGSRTFRGRAWPESSCRTPRSRWSRIARRSASWSRRQ